MCCSGAANSSCHLANATRSWATAGSGARSRSGRPVAQTRRSQRAGRWRQQGPQVGVDVRCRAGRGCPHTCHQRRGAEQSRAVDRGGRRTTRSRCRSSCYPAHLIVLGPATLCSMACLERGPSGRATVTRHTSPSTRPPSPRICVAAVRHRSSFRSAARPHCPQRDTPKAAGNCCGNSRDISTVVVAVGSGASMAGLVSVLGPERVLGVHCGAVTDPRATVARLVPATDVPIDPGVLRLDERQVGGGYGQLTDAVMDAMLTAARGPRDRARSHLHRSRDGRADRRRRGRRDPSERADRLPTHRRPAWLVRAYSGVRRALDELSERSSGALAP